jgi:hypothetical protein
MSKFPHGGGWVLIIKNVIKMSKFPNGGGWVLLPDKDFN